jgi:hypothetical protein
VGFDERRRRMSKPVRKRNVLIGVASEYLQEHQVSGANILDIMAKVPLDIADVAGLEVVR